MTHTDWFMFCLSIVCAIVSSLLFYRFGNGGLKRITKAIALEKNYTKSFTRNFLRRYLRKTGKRGWCRFCLKWRRITRSDLFSCKRCRAMLLTASQMTVDDIANANEYTTHTS